jgi:hypothetical protein
VSAIGKFIPKSGAECRFKQGIDDNAAQNAGNRVTPRDAVGKGAMLTEPIDL